MSRDIGPENRETLRRLADMLISVGHDMPTACGADVAGTGVDRMLAVRPDIFAELVRALSLGRSLDPEMALDEIASLDPEAWHALRFAVFGAYFNAPSVQKALGYAGQPAMAFDPDKEPEYLSSLDRVIARGRL